MHIVEVTGGLGNQMFCYAFAQALKHNYKAEIMLYTGTFNHVTDNRGFELDRIFKIDESIITDYEKIRNLDDVAPGIPNRIRRRIFGEKKSYFKEKMSCFDPYVFELDKNNTCLYRGLWQDENYFKDIENLIRKKFTFIPDLDKTNTDVVAEMQSSNSVSLHVRRGDYVSNPQYMGFLGGVCNYDYYVNALQYIESKESDLSIFIFSDDIEWVRENFHFLNDKKVTFINHNQGLDSYKDMQLMSNCKHNIIANSTFSWWGAWLNANPSKIVCAPETWFMNSEGYANNHLVPDHWTKISNKTI